VDGSLTEANTGICKSRKF